MARGGGKGGKGTRRGVGKGYNPYRAGDGKFKAGAHKKRIAKERSKELKARKDSLATKRQMGALKKRAAATKDPKEKARLKRQFDALGKKREKLKQKADAATLKRREASGDMKKAREKHREKRREEKEKRKADKESKGKGKKDKAKKPDQAPDPTPDPGQTLAPHWTQNAYAHTRIGQPRDKIDRKMSEAEDAFARSDYKEGRKKLEDACDEYGFEKQMRGGTDAMDRVHIPAIEGADAYHDWSGRIRLSEATADGLSRHGGLASDERRGVGDVWSVNSTRRGHDDHMRIAVHEVLHGYGPTYSHQYHGVGARVEEITTEAAARRIMHDRYGASRRQGAYAQELHNAVTAIQAHKGIADYDAAVVELERVSFAVKRERRGAGEPFNLFVRHMGAGALQPSQIEQMLNWDPPSGP